jgi:thioredoxin 1
MSTVEITHENFKKTVEQGIVILDWWASWCGPCRAFAPIFERVAGKNPDVVFGKVNTEEQQALAAQFGIRSIPTLMVFRDGILLLAQPGMLPEAALSDVVQKVRELDMDEVRKQIAAEESRDQPSAAAAQA